MRTADKFATLKCRLYINSGRLNRLELTGSIQACIGTSLPFSIILRAYVSAGKSDGKRSHGRPRRKWENNIKMDLQEVGWMSINWIHLA